MIGYATGIIGAAIGAEGMSVLVRQKGEGGHFGLRLCLRKQSGTYENVVEVSPMALIHIRSLCLAQVALSLWHQGNHPVVQHLKERIGRFGIEIAHQDGLLSLKAVQHSTDSRHGQFAMLGALSGIAGTAGKMYGQDVKRIARGQRAGGVQNIAGGAEPILCRRHPHAAMTDKLEARGLVKQGHVYAAHIRALGYQKIVACPSQGATPGQVKHNGIVLHLHKPHQQGPSVLRFHGRYGACQLVLLAPIAAEGPSAFRLRKELPVVLQTVVTAVEQVFHVPTHNRKPLAMSFPYSIKQEKEGQNEKPVHPIRTLTFGEAYAQIQFQEVCAVFAFKKTVFVRIGRTGFQFCVRYQIVGKCLFFGTGK